MEFLSFPYNEQDGVIKVLEGLSEEYDVDLDISRLLKNIRFNEGLYVFLMVTIIKFPIILHNKKD